MGNEHLKEAPLGGNMEKQSKYMMSSIEEYFDILDKQTETNSKLIAKSLVKYLKASKENSQSKYDTLKQTSKV